MPCGYERHLDPQRLWPTRWRGHGDNGTIRCNGGECRAREAGRWPPNILLSEDAAAEMDRQSGTLKSPSPYKYQGKPETERSAYSRGLGFGLHDGEYGDSGGASRFFPVFRYQAKASAKERPRLADGTAWPTVKPLELMRWLVRLVTPPGGTVLDPFAGSGTTGQACALEGFQCVLIERDPVAAQLTLERLRKPAQQQMTLDIPA